MIFQQQLKTCLNKTSAWNRIRKKTRKWDAEKEEIDDHAEKQAIEALNTLEALEALKAV